MATLYDTSALQTLNEKDYINKLYDANNSTAQKLLEENYTDNTGLLDSEKQSTQQQTNNNVTRTYLEAAKAQNAYNGPKLTLGASQQEALSRGNAQQANVTSLQQKQAEADAEIERQRSLLASQYSAAIKQAQAENDMQKAQALYDAAKAEEDQLLEFRQSISSTLANKGDTSIRDSLMSGERPEADYSGETWESVLKNEDSINEIYAKQLEAQLLALQTENEKAMSDLEAEQRQAQAETDRNLTQAYVDALQKAKNYAEVQTAYGQGSGTATAARIARDTELQKALTDLRGVQMGADADVGMQRLDLAKAYRDELAKASADVNQERVNALIDAAEEEEQTNVSLQQQIGQELAKQNNYSVLGKLYGLTQDQIDRIQGTGAYAPKLVYYGGYDDGGTTYKKSSSEPTTPQWYDIYNMLNPTLATNPIYQYTSQRRAYAYDS